MTLAEALKPFKAGEIITAKQLNDLNRAVDELSGWMQVPTQSRKKLSDVSRPPIQLQLVSADAQDYLTCYTYDGVSPGNELIYVAKPWMLRASLAGRAGVTFSYASAQERTATQGAETEVQVIVDQYVAGDIIYADLKVIGGTGVEDDYGEMIHLLDRNNDARKWAKKYVPA